MVCDLRKHKYTQAHSTTYQQTQRHTQTHPDTLPTDPRGRTHAHTIRVLSKVKSEIDIDDYYFSASSLYGAGGGGDRLSSRFFLAADMLSPELNEVNSPQARPPVFVLRSMA